MLVTLGAAAYTGGWRFVVPALAAGVGMSVTGAGIGSITSTLRPGPLSRGVEPQPVRQRAERGRLHQRHRVVRRRHRRVGGRRPDPLRASRQATDGTFWLLAAITVLSPVLRHRDLAGARPSQAGRLLDRRLPELSPSWLGRLTAQLSEASFGECAYHAISPPLRRRTVGPEFSGSARKTSSSTWRHHPPRAVRQLAFELTAAPPRIAGEDAQLSRAPRHRRAAPVLEVDAGESEREIPSERAPQPSAMRPSVSTGPPCEDHRMVGRQRSAHSGRHRRSHRSLGRLMMTPSAPSSSCSRISVRVPSKFGSVSSGREIRNEPASECTAQPSPLTMAAVDEVPSRVAPAATMAGGRSEVVRMPPLAFTPSRPPTVCGHESAPLRAWPHPTGWKPVEVLTKSAPADSAARQARTISSSVSAPDSMMTFSVTADGSTRPNQRDARLDRRPVARLGLPEIDHHVDLGWRRARWPAPPRPPWPPAGERRRGTR